MKNLSLKNVLRVVFGAASGYFAGQMAGGLLGSIIWAGAGLIAGGFPYYVTSTIIINAILSVAFGMLLAYFLWFFDKRLLEGKTPFWIWGTAGAAAGLLAMFTYGINVILHPTILGVVNGLNPVESVLGINQGIKYSQPPFYLSPIKYGGVMGQLIGIYFGVFAGLFISIRENIGKKISREDKQEFEEYTKFIKERLRK